MIFGFRRSILQLISSIRRPDFIVSITRRLESGLRTGGPVLRKELCRVPFGLLKERTDGTLTSFELGDKENREFEI